jgi:hypothetical protein
MQPWSLGDTPHTGVHFPKFRTIGGCKSSSFHHSENGGRIPCCAGKTSAPSSGVRHCRNETVRARRNITSLPLKGLKTQELIKQKQVKIQSYNYNNLFP